MKARTLSQLLLLCIKILDTHNLIDNKNEGFFWWKQKIQNRIFYRRMSVSGGELSFIDQLFAVSTTSVDSTNIDSVTKKNESVEVEVEEKVEEAPTITTTETKTMSEYERRRLENISRNNEAMRRFGIIPTEMEEAPLSA